MNFLVTAIGSMSAEAVVNSIQKNFPESNIIGTDINPKEWLYLSDKVDFFYKIPTSTNEGYIAEILQICRNHNINFILPLTDPEVDVLSTNREKLEHFSCTLTLPCDNTITVCRDKKKITDHLINHQSINLIKTYTISQLTNIALNYPVIAKPRRGRSSEGFRFIQSKDELNFIDEHDIIQEFIDGSIITVDFVRDHKGNIVSLPRRELIRSANGAGLTVEVFQDKEIEKIVLEVSKELGLIGCMNIEFIYNEGRYYLMDINPRFSAGIGFSKLRGYDFILNHIRVFQKLDIFPIGEIKKGIVVKHHSEYKLN